MAESMWAGMFQAEAGSGNTASARSTRDAISDTIASYAISDEEGARKKGSGQPLMNRSKQARMARKTIVALLVGLTLASVRLVEAQQPKKVPRIGLLRAGSPPDSYVEAFRQGLRELGYIESQNIAVEYRWAEGKPERIPDLTAELVRLKVDVIVTTGVPGGLAAKQATSTIPIVVPAINDPIGSGLVASLARPGGNVTGLSMVNPEFSEKRMELLKEACPPASPAWPSCTTLQRSGWSSTRRRLRPKLWASACRSWRCEKSTISRRHSPPPRRGAPAP